ncbi:xylulokinase [Amycolatopsis suaedae]|uniref:Xylulose kinase n=1 Tax=Amycolatopsis suaedae TaxID=2510978 RepID=A0A4Q7J6I5_9PSEU|nr:FGGY-family carbohydrate kinase [Amycolatopsis suaedae]RZQ62446.1 xylulose kinase [Amycolatopsis suaedae]
MELMIGIDVGTTAVKVVVFTTGGEPVAAHTVPYPIHRPRPGWAEQDPLDWWRGCTEGLRAVSAATHGGTVVAAGIVSQVNTHLLVDAGLRPLTPAVLWQDQRCAGEASELDARFSDEDKTRIWGGPVALDASFVGARAAWFARHTPREWAAARWILGPKDFIGAKLTGRVATDALSGVRIAGGDGYLPEAVAVVDGLAQRLPEILPPDSSLGLAAETGTGLAVGTMDAFGAVFGTRTTEPRRGMVSCGTSLVVAGASDRSVPVAGVVRFPPRGDVVVHAGPTQAAGDAVRWWSRVRGGTVEDVLASAARGSSGVLFTPYLMGERAPLWDADLRAAFLGLGSGHTADDLSRAVLDGVAMSARHVLEVVEAAGGGPLSTLVFAGGGARSELWARIHADVLGRPIERSPVPDSGALGAALLGAVAAGLFPDAETAAAVAVRPGQLVEPAAGAVERLEPLYRAYRGVHSALRGVHGELAAWRSAQAGA